MDIVKTRCKGGVNINSTKWKLEQVDRYRISGSDQGDVKIGSLLPYIVKHLEFWKEK